MHDIIYRSWCVYGCANGKDSLGIDDKDGDEGGDVVNKCTWYELGKSSAVKGSLNKCSMYWEELLEASHAVLSTIRQGYILCHLSLSQGSKNRRSADLGICYTVN